MALVFPKMYIQFDLLQVYGYFQVVTNLFCAFCWLLSCHRDVIIITVV